MAPRARVPGWTGALRVQPTACLPGQLARQGSVDALEVGGRVVLVGTEGLDGGPELRAAGLADLLQLPGLAPDCPRIRLELHRNFELGLRLLVSTFALEPRPEAEVGER